MQGPQRRSGKHFWIYRSVVPVLVISQDLEELFEIADLMAVICEGSLSEFLPSADLTVEEIGLLMAGINSPPTTGEAARVD